MNGWLRFGMLLLCCIGLAQAAPAQVEQVQIGVNGLTCSQCTRNVEMHLRRLKFVRGVQMNLEQTTGTVTVEQGAPFSPQAIARAVRDAGFSLRFLKATLNFGNSSPAPGPCFPFMGSSFQLVPAPPGPLSGRHTVQFVGEDFMPAREYRQWKPQLVPRCDAGRGSTCFFTLTGEAGS